MSNKAKDGVDKLAERGTVPVKGPILVVAM